MIPRFWSGRYWYETDKRWLQQAARGETLRIWPTALLAAFGFYAYLLLLAPQTGGFWLVPSAIAPMILGALIMRGAMSGLRRRQAYRFGYMSALDDTARSMQEAKARGFTPQQWMASFGERYLAEGVRLFGGPPGPPRRKKNRPRSLDGSHEALPGDPEE